MDKQTLLKRLDEIGQSLAASGDGLALIGLGSVGVELERLDEHSDLDFFAVVRPGCKARYLDNLGWLSRVCPIDYAFRNTPDGFKVLYRDGIFCEMAVFEPAELAEVPFAEGRLVWKADGVDDSIRRPARAKESRGPQPEEWMLGEALTCLLVGLKRYQRGEKLSAQRFIQHFAVDRVLELIERETQGAETGRDPFAIERRFEQRHSRAAGWLADFIQGYQRSRESARAILDYLEAHYKVNPAVGERIRELCQS